MDDIVKAAMSKWPNVPNCYGWLALDPRGHWRMRDERAQALNLAGDIIRNPALLGFINRNYRCDESGHWYFQNGPQKVYVDLAATPYIAQLLPNRSWRLHTGELMPVADKIWMVDDGNIICQAGHYLCQLDDRDIALFLDTLSENQRPLNEARMLEMLEASCSAMQAMSIDVALNDQTIRLEKSDLLTLMQQAGYRQRPRAT